MTSTTPYPLLFEPILKEKVWGARRLSTLNKQLPDDALIGESWEIADLDHTSASGGGGQAAHSIVRNGAAKGAALRELLSDWGDALLGNAAPVDGGFPLLIKYLDAGANLSVQVHPSEAFAAQRSDAHVKHEAWCVIHAEPGARIYRGLRDGETARSLRERVAAGTVDEALLATPARPGEILHLPSGVVHALGAGVLVAEVQTPSDTTFRLDDWGRTGRELHIEDAMASAFDDTGAQTIPFSALPAPSTTHVVTDAFDIRRHVLAPGTSIDLSFAGSPLIVMMLSGDASLECADDSTALTLRTGDTALAPASMKAAALSTNSGATALAITIP